MRIIFLVLFIIPFKIFCQTNAEVHYKSEILINFDTLQGPLKFKQVLKNSLDKSELIDFVLSINGKENLTSFKKNELEESEISKMDLLTINQILNIKGKYILNKGKLIHDYFIMEQNLKVEVEKKVNWSLTKERKKIGEYVCLKAKGIVEYGKNKGELIEVWYAPSIPLPYGPKVYFGLPGLILEVKEKNYILYADEIKFIKKTVKIKAPESNEIISEKEADSIIEIANRKAEEFFKN